MDIGKNRLHDLGFDVSKIELMAQQAMMLNRVKEEMPSAFDIAKVDDIELQEIMESAARSTKNLIAQLDDQMHPPGDLCSILCMAFGLGQGGKEH